jgi:hypothetical protein
MEITFLKEVGEQVLITARCKEQTQNVILALGFSGRRSSVEEVTPGGPFYTSEDSDGDLDPEFYIAGTHEGGRVEGCDSGCCGDYYAKGPYIGDIEDGLNVNV